MKTIRVIRRERGTGKILAAPSAAPSRVAHQFREPSVGEMLGNFAGAMADWVMAGLPIVSGEVAHARIAACRACPGHHWEEEARAGLGKCTHPKCGCTRGKMWLGTSKCPIEHWPA